MVWEQLDIGIDIPNDGGSPTWPADITSRFVGFEASEGPIESADESLFPNFFKDIGHIDPPFVDVSRWVCVGPVRYSGAEELTVRLDALSEVLRDVAVDEGFIASPSPNTIALARNEFYSSDSDFLEAIAQALHEEYSAITDRGFVLQIDDISLTQPLLNTEAGAPQRRRKAIEALNHSLAGIPEDRIRYHLCWGGTRGPHMSDLPLADIVDDLLAVKAGAYLIEGSNARHEHEWSLWKDTRLPSGKILVPGVVSHSTNVVEHPALIAERIVQYAQIVGRENVIAGTDCSLGGRVHPQIAWAKLRALHEGARIASKELWGGQRGAVITGTYA